jgi:hypothetical protein
MKNIIIEFFLFLILISVTSCSKKILDNVTFKQSLDCKKYKVESISEEGTLYVVKLSRNDTIYRVLTDRFRNPDKIYLSNQRNEGCKTEEIQVGKSYDLKLECFYKNTVKNTIYDEGIKYVVKYNGTSVGIKINETLYTTKNLKGLCLVQAL